MNLLNVVRCFAGTARYYYMHQNVYARSGFYSNFVGTSQLASAES